MIIRLYIYVLIDYIRKKIVQILIFELVFHMCFQVIRELVRHTCFQECIYRIGFDIKNIFTSTFCGCEAINCSTFMNTIITGYYKNIFKH